VVLPGDGPLKGKLDSLGCRTILLDLPFWIGWGRRSRTHIRRLLQTLPWGVAQCRQIIQTEGISLVYTNTISCPHGAIAAKREHKPHIWHIHEVLRGHKHFTPYLPTFLTTRLISLFSDRIIVPSETGREGIKVRSQEGKIRVVNNGVDLKKFHPGDSGRRLRRKLGIGQDVNVVAMIGSVVELKGYLEFVEAAQRVAREMENVVFLAVGREFGSDGQKVRNSAEVSGISDKMKFIGFREDVAEILQSVDLVVVASRVESFSRTACEAMAAGKPVVATRCGGPEEIVVDGVTGFLVPVKSPRQLAGAMLKILTSEQTRKRMGEAGRRRAEEMLDVRRYVSRIEKVIDEVC
jgi:glycosyltransferase involved in cell wall biosynthesis